MNLVHLKTAKTIKAHNSREFYLIFLLIVFRAYCSQWFLKKSSLEHQPVDEEMVPDPQHQGQKGQLQKIEEILSKLLDGRNW